MEVTDKAMEQPAALASAPRCLARNRQGKPCQRAAMRGRKRCANHGGKATGAPTGPANGNYRHGRRTREMAAQRALFRLLTRSLSEDPA